LGSALASRDVRASAANEHIKPLHAKTATT
jgi:hypothetical protein